MYDVVLVDKGVGLVDDFKDVVLGVFEGGVGGVYCVFYV